MDKATVEKDASATEETKVEEEVEEKVPVQPKIGLMTRAKLSVMEKTSSADEAFKSKFPSAHEKAAGYYSTIKDVWAETFPHQKSVTQDRMEKRRERARLAKEMEERQKEMTPEEIEAL